MNKHVNAISGRLSLREPQRDSLEILARLAEILPLEKQQDVAGCLDIVRSEFPNVQDFEREFPSLCFALATGVGKTRLMGAFISFLRMEKGLSNFFVLAPNLTIYNKLIADFTPNNPKYVFQGIGEFAVHPPEIITGDTFEGGRGVRLATLNVPGFEDDRVHINIFNISKINSEVRGGRTPRVKELREVLGRSYFDYLADLDDLVLLMDESHRYRASAGVKAINELKPILGLELTATPQIETSGGSNPFKNVIYSYPLYKAMADGYVKEPAVGTRENFKLESYSDDELELLKLKDGIQVHEDTKVELEVYARQQALPIVKPFMLVVAQDTNHANSLLETIKSESFFGGQYSNRVITVHSNQRGEEKDETVQQLLTVEDPANQTEIVIHVNMLKEGWDVTNLYTIVPLRAANSRTLVEQSIGRGLRLPYGKRTGVPAVDRLTIVAHDKFQSIIDDANKETSIIRTGVFIGRDVAVERKEVVVVEPNIVSVISGKAVGQQAIQFVTKAEQEIAQTTYDLIRRYERLPSSSHLTSDKIQAELVQEVRAIYAPIQGAIEGLDVLPDVEDIVATVTVLYIDNSIDIPRITVVPTNVVTFGYYDFDLEPPTSRWQPVDSEILIQHLRTNERFRLLSRSGDANEARLENYIVRDLMDLPDVPYDEHSDLLYKLAGQCIDHVRSYITAPKDVENVVHYHHRDLAKLIYSQMQMPCHRWQTPTNYLANVRRGFTTLRSATISAVVGQGVRNFRAPVDDKLNITAMRFGGFDRCLYPEQRFQSDTERKFAVVCENDESVIKWFKPSIGHFQIDYAHGTSYQPDFVVETKTVKLICEPKRASEMQDEVVLSKKAAAVLWCQHATDHAKENGGKPWSYLLIPHDAITAASTLNGLGAAYTVSPT